MEARQIDDVELSFLFLNSFLTTGEFAYVWQREGFALIKLREATS